MRRPVESALISAEIIRFDDERQQIELSHKAVLPKPYVSFRDSHRVGELVTGVVANTIPALAFVDLGGGAQGSIHVSQLANFHVGHPDEVVRKGQQLTLMVLGFDDARERIQLSLKAVIAAQQPPLPRAAARVATPPSRPSPQTVVAEGASVEDAVATACHQLRVSSHAVSVEVLDEGQPKRLFRPGRQARVRVTTR